MRHSHFVRGDELEIGWKIFTPLLHELEEKKVKPIPYVRGSRGPEEADKLRDANGFVRSIDYEWKEPVLENHVGIYVRLLTNNLYRIQKRMLQEFSSSGTRVIILLLTPLTITTRFKHCEYRFCRSLLNRFHSSGFIGGLVSAREIR